jgi:D-sedoheptulose 7-phosphate isomerase
MNYEFQYLLEMKQIIENLDVESIEQVVDLILSTRNSKGRIFFLGVGGSAANASHAVCDFRKIVGIESYSPTDNISELTAHANDNGWDSIFVNWLKESHLNSSDLVFVLSVGGGNLEMNISPNLVKALAYAKEIGSKIAGIIGRDGGYTKKVSTACVLIPIVNLNRITPHTESFQVAIWHLLISHPKLQQKMTKWEIVGQNIAIK